jgi:hypothetical protein
MSGSGLFCAKSLIPYGEAQDIFKKFMRHPVAIIFEREVLKNNRFSLKLIDSWFDNINSERLGDNGVNSFLAMWWASSLIRNTCTCDPVILCDCEPEIFGPFDYTDADILPGDTLLEGGSEYIIDTISPYHSTEGRFLRDRKNACRDTLNGCVCCGDVDNHNYWLTHYYHIKSWKLALLVNNIIQKHELDRKSGIQTEFSRDINPKSIHMIIKQYQHIRDMIDSNDIYTYDDMKHAYDILYKLTNVIVEKYNKVIYNL